MVFPHKLVAVLTAFFITIAGASVAAASPSAAPVPTLTIALASAPKTLDPALASDAASARVVQLTNPALLRWNARYEAEGLVATRCAQRGVTVACHIPAGRVFQNGTPVTAQSLKGWFTFLKNTPQSPHYGTLAQVADIQAMRPDVLGFTLVSPSLSFMGTLVDIPLAPSPTTTEVGMARPGAGAYTVAALDTLGQVTLRPVRAASPTLVLLPVADPTTRLLKVLKGEVDVVYNDIPPELVRWAKQKGLGVQSVPSTSYTYLAVNFGNEWLVNPLVRQGLRDSLDVAAIRRYVLGGLAEPAGTLLPPGHPAAWEAPEPKMRDIFHIMGVLDDAGTFGDANSPRFTVSLLTSTDALSQRVAQVLQQHALEVGIQLEVTPMEWGAFYDAVKQGRFDMALMSWSGEQQPDILYRMWHSTQAPPTGLNRGRVAVPALDEALNVMMAAPTREALNAAAIQVQQRAAEWLPYIPLYRRHHVMLTRPTVTGCTLMPNGSYWGLAACRGK